MDDALAVVPAAAVAAAVAIIVIVLALALLLLCKDCWDGDIELSR